MGKKCRFCGKQIIFIFHQGRKIAVNMDLTPHLPDCSISKRMKIMAPPAPVKSFLPYSDKD